MKLSKTRILAESAILIAIATVLSMLKLVDLPYGGSITIASMLPIVILSYRHGLAWGLGSGLAYGVVQQLLGLNSLSWVTGWKSYLMVILFDYVIAFAVAGLGGLFRKMEHQGTALVLGSVLVSVLRYACHFVSGVTVWRDISIPGDQAILYSLAYNATYMLPEAIVLVIAAWYLGTTMDLRRESPVRVIRSASDSLPWTKVVSGLVLAGMLIFDVASVFAHLQDSESGEFFIQGLADVNWILVCVVTFVCLAAFAALRLLGKNKKERP